jgi:hypothetical protein
VAAPAAAVERVRGVVHVHSDLSTGDFGLESLVGLADQQKIDAVLLTENYLARVEYGLPPFRALTRIVREERSVGAAPERYLARVAEVRARLPHVLLIPGVETMPHYHWTGSPLALDMTVHDLQKNLLVFGLTDPAALRALPVVGNPAAGRYTVQSALDALPGLLLVPGVILVAWRRRIRHRLGRGAYVVVHQRAWARGLALCAIGVAALARGWPFTVEALPTSDDPGVAPYQALIDYVDRLGGVTVWSFPEARDIGEQYVGPVHVGWLTEPYGDDLLRTFRYTAFGGVYEDTSTFEEPGRGWDRLLGEYVRGERSRPAWAVAESGFHGYTTPKRIGPVQTVFLARERTEAAVLEALRDGRMYAVYRTRDVSLELAELTVTAAGSVGGIADTVRAPAGTPLEVRIGIDATDGDRHDVRVMLVRNGRLVAMERGATPYRTVYRETSDGTPLVLRVEARGTPPLRVLSNPIFVRP